MTNLITNPSVESGTATWAVYNASITSSNSWSLSGTNSALITPTAASNDSFTAVGGDTGALRQGMEAGKTYTVSATIYLPAPQAGSVSSYARRIVVFTKVGTAAYAATVSAIAPNATGATRLSHTFTLPAGATEAFIRLYNGASLNNGVVSWDSVMLTEGTNQDNYADGNSSNWVWNGTANNSTSTGPPL